jgi:hypothetical protein
MIAGVAGIVAAVATTRAGMKLALSQLHSFR